MGDAEQVSPDVPTTAQIQQFLEERHRASVSGLHALAGGFWSSAFAYRVGERELVLRLGSVRDGFEMDRLAMGFDRPDLPVPRVLDVGAAFGRAFAISERCHGRSLEGVDPAQVDAAGPTLERTLAALRAVPAAAGAPAAWYPPDGVGPASTWRRWLTDGLVDGRHCYELHIGATHLAWSAWTGNHQTFRRVARRTQDVLSRGSSLT